MFTLILNEFSSSGELIFVKRIYPTCYEEVGRELTPVMVTIDQELSTKAHQ